MTGAVDRLLGSRADIRQLIGNNPRRMMLDNHRNHAEFISSVLVFGEYAFLPKSLPWVYRAYLSHGFSPDYFVVELEGWKAAISEHLPPEHAAEILPLYDWMLAQHEDSIQAARRRPETLLCGHSDWDEPRRQYFEAIRAGTTRAAYQIASDALKAHDDLLLFFKEVLSPSMSEIGLLWEVGELSPAREHRATAISIRVLAQLSAQLPQVTPTRGKALVGAAPNEYHELGAQMLALLLEQDGWDLSYLGADTPEEDFLGMACEEQPTMVALSVAMPYNVEQAGTLIQHLRQHPETRSTRIMLGGHAFAALPEAGHALQPDALPGSLQEAIQTARTWSTP